MLFKLPLQQAPRRWRSQFERSSRVLEDGFSNPRRDTPKSLKQKMTHPRINARQDALGSLKTQI